MTVKELITKLLDRPMIEEVHLCYNKEHIDDCGEICTGYAFSVDDVQGSEIMFTDWRDTEPSYNSVNSLAESKLKNPKAKTFDILRFVADNAGLSTFEAIEKAYNMGVSEQEPVLDKIRAEIGKLRPNLRPEQMTDYDYAMVDVVNDIVAIFDKYRAESEEINE